MENNSEHSTSLNKYISATGICSRREADAWIAAGRLTINGAVAVKGNRVFDGDLVLLDGKPLKNKPETLYIAFNKPIGIVCTTDPKEPKNIIRFINHPQRLFPVGRLDKDSQGLIFLTNDGDIVNKILRAGNRHEKKYIVQVAQPVTAAFVKQMAGGLPILGTMTQKCRVERIDDHTFKIILTQGLNRQIRRMCELLGYDVVRLKRVRIMHIAIGKLRPGQWRTLTREETQTLQALVAESSKTVDTPSNPASAKHFQKKK
jgi:23S rRNA pseudouridine2604 synthase